MSDESFDRHAENNPGTTSPKLSKSARKREMAEQQKIVVDLLALSADKLSRLPLSEDLNQAISLAKKLKQREARNRQLRYIGKLIRAENQQQIVATLDRIRDDDRFFHQRLQRLINIREELIAGGSTALESLTKAHPELDRQQLRRLIRLYQNETISDESNSRGRKLLTYLRDTLSFD
jgi:ribosome-associated protein